MPDEKVDGRRRVVVESVEPQIDCGRFAIKRVVGDTVVVEADVFADGNDLIACHLVFWRENTNELHTSFMEPIGNDRWRGQFQVESIGRYRYTVEGWVDHFQTWRIDLMKRIASDQYAQTD